jgi:hypothetical protein
VELDTSLISAAGEPVKGGDTLDLVSRSTVVLRAPATKPDSRARTRR